MNRKNQKTYHFAENLREIRKRNGLTQDQLSKITGIKRSSIGSYEEGRAIARPAMVLIFCRAFKIPDRDYTKFLCEKGFYEHRDGLPLTNVDPLIRQANDLKEKISIIYSRTAIDKVIAGLKRQIKNLEELKQSTK